MNYTIWTLQFLLEFYPMPPTSIQDPIPDNKKSQ